VPILNADTNLNLIFDGRYRAERVIGAGGSSTVYRALDEKLGRIVAIKLFTPGELDPSRQETEIAVLSALEHHSVISLHDAGVHVDEAGRPSRYLVMAHVSGTDLRTRLHGPRISTRHIAEVGYDISEALEYIHSRSVIHRDVKPSNIMLVDYGIASRRARAQLTDFGIALTNEAERITREGRTTGTAAYLSPEQARGEPLSGASDVYSLGLVLLEALTRRVEYPGSPVESALARLSRGPVIPDVAPHWQGLLTAMLQSDQRDRPTARELVALLRQVVIADSARHKEEDSDFEVATDASVDPHDAMLRAIPNEVLHRVTAMAARLFDAPIAAVSLVRDGTARLASYFGDDVEEIVRQLDVTTTTAPSPERVIISDASVDERVKGHPLVLEPFTMRFYVGMPLKAENGVVLGTLAVLDRVVKEPTEQQLANLEDLAALVLGQIGLRSNTGQVDRFPSVEVAGKGKRLNRR
jgi:serine/threonine protein kinase